jgi:PAS domain S-box-containing protein
MIRTPDKYQAMIARLAAEPDLSVMAQPGAVVLVWDQTVDKLLWASPAAQGLRDALTVEAGWVASDLRAKERLKVLAAGAAPREGARTERLRLNPLRPWQSVSCLCRLATLEDGETVLVTVVLGAIPKLPIRHEEASQPVIQPEPGAAEEVPVVQEKPRGPIRFIWQADADMRFIQVSPGLAQAVGHRTGDVVGRTWDELTQSVVHDPDGSIAALTERGETWSGRTVFWTLEDPSQEVPVDLAGMAVFGADREIIGYRGFGLLRMDDLRERAIPPEVSRSATQESSEEPPQEFPEDFLQDAAEEPQKVPEAREAPEEISSAPAVEAFLTDETLPFAPPEEAQAEEVTASGEAAPAEEENWFANLRDRVAEALSTTKLPEATPEPEVLNEKAIKATKPEPPSSSLSNAERHAFREIARALGARIEGEGKPQTSTVAPASAADDQTSPIAAQPAPQVSLPRAEEFVILPGAPAKAEETAPTPEPRASDDQVLDRLPIGILVHRGERILFANRFLLDLTGYADADELVREGGLVQLFRDSPALTGSDEDDTGLALTARTGDTIAVTVRTTETEWEGEPAQLMLIRRALSQEVAQRTRDSRVLELEAILDTATDGVILFDEAGRILSLNRSAEALFGYHQREVVGSAITVLLAPDSHMVALDYLESLRSPGVASLLNDGREVLGRERQGGTIPLFMTMGSVGDGANRKFCAVLRDMTTFKKAEGELVGAKRAAEEASAQKSDLLAKISHGIRTPLNAILGFAEVMLEERFGPIGNDRYKEYLRDVHASGSHVISLVNDLLDLAKVEAGRLELSFTGVNLNDLVSSCVTLLQPQAARDRIVMRMSFAPKLPPVVADERSMRQIVLNLVSNAIKFTDAGGQVIVSTAMTDRGEVAFRVRDTGIGMTESEIEAALEPFRQVATSRKPGGTGLGLPLTKALVEANRGALQIASNPNEGTLVEVIFPPTRVLAE